MAIIMKPAVAAAILGFFTSSNAIPTKRQEGPLACKADADCAQFNHPAGLTWTCGDLDLCIADFSLDSDVLDCEATTDCTPLNKKIGPVQMNWTCETAINKCIPDDISIGDQDVPAPEPEKAKRQEGPLACNADSDCAQFNHPAGLTWTCGDLDLCIADFSLESDVLSCESTADCTPLNKKIGPVQMNWTCEEAISKCIPDDISVE